MIVDTSVVLGAIERRDPKAVEAIEKMDRLSVRSMVVLGELTFGVEASTACSLEPELDRATCTS